jgi:hypothetical protein
MKVHVATAAGYAAVAVVLAAVAAYAYKQVRRPVAARPDAALNPDLGTLGGRATRPAPVGGAAVPPPAPKKDKFQQALDDARAAYAAYQEVKGA